jgi:hypothetical protein
VPWHFTAGLTFGFDLFRDGRDRRRGSLRIDAENITDHVHRVAQDNEFAAGQFAPRRLVPVTAKVRF